MHDRNAPAIVDAWGWNMSEADLRPLPPYKGVRRTGAIVVSLPVGAILDRISSFMRLQSISCDFRQHEGSLSCLTAHRSHFMIFLWRSQHAKQTIIEVERRQGCSVEMQRLRRGLFAAIRSGSQQCTNTTVGSAATIPKYICPLVRRLYNERAIRKKNESQIDSERRSCREGMSKCRALLQSKNFDQQRLGMEQLVFLTDSSSIQFRTAEDVSRALLYEEDHCPCAQPMRDEFMKYFGDSNLQLIAINYDDIESAEFTEAHMFTVMHSLALEALANALQVVTVDQKDSEKRINLDSEFWRTISKALLYNLVDAVARPQEAALSAKCLAQLGDVVPGATHRLVKDQALPYLVRAHKFGEAHHLSLERESQRLICQLGS